ncbi:MAG: DUF3467 domain-containing protein [Burkholderiales bacterium]
MDKQDTKPMPEPLRTDYGDDLPKVIWDDSEMETSYANACNIAATREEVILFLGTNQSLRSAHPNVTIALSHRIVLNPYAAKRLAEFLELGLKEYEAQYGVLVP